MKTGITFLLLTFCTFFAAFAQTEQGTVLLSGTVSYNNTNYKFNSFTNQTSAFALQPQIGWFISRNLVIGVAPLLTYNHESNNAPQNANYSNSTTLLGGGIFLRYYLMVNSQFGFYPQLNAGYATGIRQTPANVAEGRLVPNLVYFPVPKVGINVGIGNIGYSHQKDTDGSATRSFNSGFSGNNVSLGVSYHFVK